ncbi:sensor histidine kinase [Actibacterium ureilyticum]|uniref:sensor histidine kinase n=1 Tax=Actibacterium ureilyticum TaxID=1590614 RepID=UPI000BAAC63A|nr:HAMP domain-containing sensor histidine kinase [Actibacterium ureilyticum]
MTSLRTRAISGGLLWIVFCLSLGALGVLAYINNVAERRFMSSLAERHLQVMVALANSGAEAEALESYLPDPAYRRPFSGRYWQIMRGDDTIMTSQSLLDGVLNIREEVGEDPVLWRGQAPDGAPLRGIVRTVAIDDGPPWLVLVAESEADLAAEKLQVGRSVALGFGLLAGLGILAAGAQIAAVLRPLSKLRSEVQHRWDAGEVMEPEDYPAEVAPLVQDINTLLDRNRDVIDRSRRQAADLAHALKTPSAILRNELHALGQRGADTAAAAAALDRVDAQIARSLARMRADNSAGPGLRPVDLTDVANRLSRAMRKIADLSGKRFESRIAPDIHLRVDAQDIEEIVGNLIDNAFKWSRQTVHFTVRKMAGEVWLMVEDDGAGIDPAQIEEVLKSGARLDTSKAGSGLGLTIAKDLVAAHGGKLDLDRSQVLGGLRATCRFPAVIA